jgi:hypothetical protein
MMWWTAPNPGDESPYGDRCYESHQGAVHMQITTIAQLKRDGTSSRPLAHPTERAQMRAGLFAFSLASLFLGAALYINVVEQPGRARASGKLIAAVCISIDEHTNAARSNNRRNDFRSGMGESRAGFTGAAWPPLSTTVLDEFAATPVGWNLCAGHDL